MTEAKRQPQKQAQEQRAGKNDLERQKEVKWQNIKNQALFYPRQL